MGEAFQRQALLSRFVTDLYVVLADEPSARPAEQICCWLSYQRPEGRPGETSTYALPLCGAECHHVHHRHEIVPAAMERRSDASYASRG